MSLRVILIHARNLVALERLAVAVIGLRDFQFWYLRPLATAISHHVRGHRLAVLARRVKRLIVAVVYGDVAISIISPTGPAVVGITAAITQHSVVEQTAAARAVIPGVVAEALLIRIRIVGIRSLPARAFVCIGFGDPGRMVVREGTIKPIVVRVVS